MSKNLKILIADDEQDLRKYIIHILKNDVSHSFSITEVEDGLQAIEASQKNEFDLILLDVKMPEMSGLEALPEIKSQNKGQCHIIIMTAHGNVKDAVNAIKQGAYDYLEKPLDHQQVIKIFEQSLAAKELVEEVALSRPVLESDTETEIIGQSQSMKDVFHLVHKLTEVDSTVLLRGENGTGKDLVAKAIHLNSSRKDYPLVTVNCAAIPDGLVESELFGHEKGAFTGAHERKIGKFQMANQGTLFLDEVGELKLEVQAKLLRALQDQTFMPVGSNRVLKTNARIIAATNRNLEKLMMENGFREDLFFRLNVLPIFIPPLRERREDIRFLVNHFIARYNESGRKKTLSPEALERLEVFSWPGNIRQLENVIQRALILGDTDTIEVSSLPEEIQGMVVENSKDSLDFEKFKMESEKSFIIKALKANGGRINRTVANANIPKNTLLRKIKKFDIEVKSLADASSRAKDD